MDVEGVICLQSHNCHQSVNSFHTHGGEKRLAQDARKSLLLETREVGESSLPLTPRLSEAQEPVLLARTSGVSETDSPQTILREAEF